jgi:hypothetical protein
MRMSRRERRQSCKSLRPRPRAWSCTDRNERPRQIQRQNRRFSRVARCHSPNELMSDRKPDSTRTKHGDLPAPVVRGERSGPKPTRGVARLLAVADLTVKTNIRTARRGTLRGARASPTMQAGIGAYQACEVLAVRESYVGVAKLDKFWPAMDHAAAWRRRERECLCSIRGNQPMEPTSSDFRSFYPTPLFPVRFLSEDLVDSKFPPGHRDL